MPVDKLKKEECCGCNACGDVCPTKAISFPADNEGFWYPKVDYDKCINCELCTGICPEINIKALKHNDFEEPLCYAAENKNLEVVFDSTSGGMFSAFADKFYRESGYVGGAVYSEDFKSLKQYISPDKADLPRLRSSKYLQSNLEGFYLQVKKLLDAGEKVLVCGCPCQMAGLRSFLRKDYDNLLILDFVCLGINSPLLWERFMDSFEDRYGSKVTYVKSKSKEYGWRNLTLKVKLANGSVKYEKRDECEYTRGYIGTHSFIRPACYSCVFRGFPRISDITLADFWGIEKYNNSLEKNLGTSLLMINSEKGKKWFEKIEGRLNCIPMSFKAACEGNPALTRSPGMPKFDREQFFADARVLTFGELAKKYGFSTRNNEHEPMTLRRFLKGLYINASRLKNKLKTPCAALRTLKANSIKGILQNKYISLKSYAYCSISKGAGLKINGKLTLGGARNKKNNSQTLLMVEDNALLDLRGDFVVPSGADIEVFKGGELIIKGGGGANINLTIICADKVEIGHNVIMGRGVTIRDNNGGHYLNRAGYKDHRPVIIGDKVWLCEGCTIMPGVKIGEGAIVGAHALVTSNVPPFTMVSGNPAKIVDEDILWKY